MLSFYRPAFLWGLVFLAVPVIIHFFNRRRTVLLDFSTIRFFRVTAVHASKIRRLKRMLLLCSRCLLIAVIVGLFAKPFDKRNPFAALSDPNGMVFCWVDPTLSMNYKDGDVSLWERALSLVDSLGKKASFPANQYWFSDAQGEFIPEKGFFPEKGAFPRKGTAHVQKMITSFKSKSRNAPGFPVLVIVSDFQENISRTFDSLFLFDQIKTPIMCISVAPHAAWNFGIQKTFISREQTSTVVSAIAAQGRPCPQTGVSVISGGMRLGHGAVSMKTGERVTVRVEISNDHRTGGGSVSLDIEDPFPYDNVRYFALEGSKSLRVLVIGDSVKSFPIAAAFRSMQKDWWRPVIVMEPRAIGYNDIDSADCIVLNEVPFLPRPVQILISTRSLGKKAILYSPGVDSGSAFAASEVLNSAGKRQKILYTGSTISHFLSFSDTLSVLWKGFHGLNNMDVAIYRYWGPLPGEALCALDNKIPFASQLIDSLGNSWVLFASPVGLTQSNNLCQTGLYVPLLDRISRFALESIHIYPEEWLAGYPRRNPFYGSRRPALIDNQQGKRIAQWDNQPWVVFDEPGIYRIQPFGLPGYEVAVNIDPEEALFAYRFPEAPSSAKNRVKCSDYNGFLRSLHEAKGPVFYNFLWIMLAALMFVEMLLWEKVDKSDNRKGNPPVSVRLPKGTLRSERK